MEQEKLVPVERLEYMEARCNKLREALDRIARPLWWIQEDHKRKTGSINGLDGAVALALAEDVEYFKYTADKALVEDPNIAQTEKMLEPLDFITLLRESSEYIKDIYSGGDCYKFSLILQKIYGGKPMINREGTHVVTNINGINYDINGINSEAVWHVDERVLAMMKKWSFKKNMALKIAECPACGEPYKV